MVPAPILSMLGLSIYITGFSGSKMLQAPVLNLELYNLARKLPGAGCSKGD